MTNTEFRDKLAVSLERVSKNPDPFLKEAFDLIKVFEAIWLRRAGDDPFKISMVHRAHSELVFEAMLTALGEGE